MQTRPWHIREPIRFEFERREIETTNPGLRFLVSDEGVVVEGIYAIRDDSGVIDEFAVRVILPTDYPDSAPVVFETGGRTPRDPDRHVNRDGTACVLLPESRWQIWPAGSSLVSFFDGPIKNFFVSQGIVERGGPWPFGQWSHGDAGRREYYREVFGTDNVVAVRGFLSCAMAPQFKGHWDCPCGSGQRIRGCHMEMILSLRLKMSRNDARLALRDMDRDRGTSKS